MSDFTPIDIPFDYRHHCWFCGEPSQLLFNFPQTLNANLAEDNDYFVLDCPHPPISVPCCGECCRLAKLTDVDSIWAVNYEVKQKLLKIYQKDLAIGINWTKDELANSEFEGGNFSGFQKSAWFIFEVAKSRVNFKGWHISYHGVDVDMTTEALTFIFDGVTYPCIDDAVNHYIETFGLNRIFFCSVLNKVGKDRFGYAIRFCRLLIGATAGELKLSLRELQ